MCNPFPYFAHRNNLNFCNNSNTHSDKGRTHTKRLANKLLRRIMLEKKILANYSVRNCQCNELRDWFRWHFKNNNNNNNNNQGFPQWHNGESCIFGVLGSFFSPAQEVKDLALPQLQFRSKLLLGSDPWPRNSICCKVAKNGKEKKKIPKLVKQLCLCGD